ISKQKVLVEGLNIIKKATKPNPMMGQQGGIIQMEAPIPASRVMLYSHKASKPTRISKDVITDTTTGKTKRVRICKHTKEQLDD
ncbi:MAG: 50S ribosomal protein L24, partial [Cyanobacteria bacterium]|nr:50S ribosomal protein L24 [Cyanobacteriota bacterium]